MNLNFKVVAGFLLILSLAVWFGKSIRVPVQGTLMAQGELDSPSRRVLGPVTTVREDQSELQFLARVDTGARTCSLHTARKKVIDGSKFMEENVGKTIRFLVENRRGKSEWLTRIISEVRKIRTSEGEETRYLVPITLKCKDVEREVLVSLNDRSQMSYSLLLGRNFLAGEFVVDVTDTDDDPGLLVNGL